MDKPAAFQGTYSDLKFIRSRGTAQVVIEIPIEHAGAFVAAFGTPQPSAEVPVAIARIVPEAERPAPAAEDPSPEARQAWADMHPTQQASIRCTNPRFRRFLVERHHAGPAVEDAAAFVRDWCGVASRRDITAGSPAAAKWKQLDDQFWLWIRGLDT